MTSARTVSVACRGKATVESGRKENKAVNTHGLDLQ